jgi:formylglycine-generating enzyme required for sulfatase activity
MKGTGSRAVWASGCALLVLMAVGCGHKSPLADRCAELPEGISLPAGFAPLKGHYGFGNEDDDYGGWPRYIVSERDHMIMVYVPSMQLMMGGGLQVDEVPARQIVVNHFYIDLHEVTNGQFYCFAKSCRHGSKINRCCSGNIDPCPDPNCISTFRRFWVPCLNDNHPARNVSWRQARAYAEWAGKYLPTEAQWEAAARGIDRRIYPWGNEEVSETTRFLCNARTALDDYDGYTYTAPVMNFAAGVSPFGAFNMSGNVWEWCDDYYDPGRYAYPSNEDPATGLERGPKAFGDENYPNPLEKDIREARVGPLRGDERVIRGGSFADPIERCRVDVRAGARTDTLQNNIGFRCVLPLPPMEMAAR